MKKYLLLLAFVLLPLFHAGAQVVGKSSNPSLEFVIKRVTDMGNGTVRLNLFITNHGKQDLVDVRIQTDLFEGQKTQAFDDEGNVYSGKTWLFQIGGQTYKFNFQSVITSLDLPVEVPVKVLIDVREVDKFATAFLRFDLAVQNHAEGVFVQFKNIPLPEKQ